LSGKGGDKDSGSNSSAGIIAATVGVSLGSALIVGAIVLFWLRRRKAARAAKAKANALSQNQNFGGGWNGGRTSTEPIKLAVEVVEIDSGNHYHATNSPAPPYHKFGGSPDISPISTKKEPASSAKFYELE
jgi:hypothetical protein